MSDTTNSEKLKAFVAGHIAIAAGKSPAEGDAHLMKWADWLNGQMYRLGRDETPAHLAGLNAFDIANARDQLGSAASARAA